ncbi:MAG: YhbY family RNA-binding protein, partial [Deltaproteobacteria bacterium]|nr:YhbY family RNA-binding protein [Deltaproteobacteria bacterium]
MKKLQGFQKKHLRGLAHSLKPVVFIGQKGITDTVVRSINEALNSHELIKVKFIDFKENRRNAKLKSLIKTQKLRTYRAVLVMKAPKIRNGRG